MSRGWSKKRSAAKREQQMEPGFGLPRGHLLGHKGQRRSAFVTPQRLRIEYPDAAPLDLYQAVFREVVQYAGEMLGR